MSNTQAGKKWYYCPECGCEEIVNENLVGKGYRECQQCGQEWWTDINYTDTVRTVLASRTAEINKLKSSTPPQEGEPIIEKYCRCTCSNDLQYSNCDKKCERWLHEMQEGDAKAIAEAAFNAGVDWRNGIITYGAVTNPFPDKEQYLSKFK